jgi:hypothetical protein
VQTAYDALVLESQLVQAVCTTERSKNW